jgi:hypothetical protein
MLHNPNQPTEQVTTCSRCSEKIIYQNGRPLSAYATLGSGNMNCVGVK